MMYNNLPVYKATIDSEELGMYLCSLVDEPAIEEGWIAFSKEERITLSIEDEEQRMVFGPVMVPDKPIYRVGNGGYEYYLVFDRETIKNMTEKFLADMQGGTADVNHSFEVEEGVYLHQVLIKDEEKGISPKGYEHLPNGTLFMQYHIDNDEVWDKVKSGELTGFSLAGVFDIVQLKENKPITKNSKMNKLKEMLRSILATLSNVSTDKGLLGYASDGRMPLVDEEVKIIAEDGSESVPEDGEYVLETKDVLVIKDGRVAEIREYEMEEPSDVAESGEDMSVEEVEEKKKRKACGMEDAEVAVKNIIEEGNVENVESIEAPSSEEKDAKIAELEAEIAEKEAEIESLEARIKELEEAPSQPSAEDVFRTTSDFVDSTDKKLSNLRKLLNAK